MRADIHDGGAFSRSVFQAIAKTATAGGAGDNTEVNGAWQDREGDNGIAMSAKLVIVYEAVLGDGETLSFAANFQDATDANGTGADDYGDVVATQVVATGNSGGETVDGTVEIDVDLSGAKQFVRTQATPNLSAGSTDTLKWSSVLMFYGDKYQPATGAIAKVKHP